MDKPARVARIVYIRNMHWNFDEVNTIQDVSHWRDFANVQFFEAGKFVDLLTQLSMPQGKLSRREPPRL